MARFAFVKVQALSTLFLFWQAGNCEAFVPLKNVKVMKNLSLRSTAAPVDPYELQYQKYFQAQTAAKAPSQPVESAPKTTAASEQYSYLQQPVTKPVQQQPQFPTYSNPAPTTTVDPYELQYRQYFKTQTQPKSAPENSTPAAVPEPKPTTNFSMQSTYLESLNASNNRAVESPQAPLAASTTFFPPVDASNNMNVEQDTVTKNDNKMPQYVQTPPQVTVAPETTRATDNSAKVQADEEMTPEEYAALEDKYLKMVSSEFEYKKFLGQNPYALTDIPFGVIFSRYLDTLEDAAIARKNKNAKPIDVKADRPTVVVLGTGWGAHAFVKLSSTLDLRIIVVSPVNHFVFTPMLASAAVGTVEYRSMTEPIRVTNPNIENYIEGRATAVDVKNKRVTVQLTSESIASTGKINKYTNEKSNFIQVPYDHLVCAVGTKVRSSIVPGAQEHCFNLKTTQDSKKLRTAVQEALENAMRADVEGWGELTDEKRWRRISFVIIGGGPTGVELAGELNDFLMDICQPYKGPYQRLAGQYSITLIHGGSDLLPQFDTHLRQRALKALEQRGVTVRLNTRVSEVGKKFVTIRRKGAAEDETIAAGVTVWAAGNEPVSFVQSLMSQLPESAVGTAGRIKVDRWLRAPTHSPEDLGSIIVLGDAADLQAKRNDPKSSLPQTAQVAGQQGAFIARMLNRGYDLNRTPPKLPEFDDMSPMRIWLLIRGLEEAPDFVFLNLGLLAYVGGGEALTQVQAGDVPIVGLSGKGAFALWRSVYLAKQASMKNRSQLIFDWAKSQSFGRDLTRM